jgi:hypothetical protein
VGTRSSAAVAVEFISATARHIDREQLGRSAPDGQISRWCDGCSNRAPFLKWTKIQAISEMKVFQSNPGRLTVEQVARYGEPSHEAIPLIMSLLRALCKDRIRSAEVDV